MLFIYFRKFLLKVGIIALLILRVGLNYESRPIDLWYKKFMEGYFGKL